MADDEGSEVHPFIDIIHKFLHSKSGASLIYNGTIILMGFIVLTLVRDENKLYFLGRPIGILFIWFLLMINLDPPDAAKLESEPFKEDLILDQ